MIKVHQLDKKWPHEENEYYLQYKLPFVSSDTSVLFNCAQNSRTSNCLLKVVTKMSLFVRLI
jgi:hypothetical protein